MRSVHQICESLDPADGGAPVVAVHIAAAQAAAGSSAEIVLHGIRRRASVASPRDLVEIHHSLPGMGNVRVERHASARSLGRFLRGTVSAQDVVHLHGVWDLSLLLAGAASRRCGAAYVVTPHGMLDPWCLRQSRWKKRLVLAVAVRRFLDRAAFIQALTGDESRLMGPLGLKSRVCVVPNGVELPEVSDGPGSTEPVEVGGQKVVGPYFLFLARLHHKKGVDVLLEAYRRVVSRGGAVWPLVVAGPDDGGATQLRREVEAWDLPGRVVVPGPVYGDQKDVLLERAGALVLPSRQEGFSLTILEAMAAAKPVIISDQCHFPEVAACGAGLEVAVDGAAVGKAMAAVQSWSVDKRGAAGAAGRALVERSFTWPRVADRLLSEYRAGLRSLSPDLKV